MDWLARYVENVKAYLPAKLRDDVGNELYSDLQDQYDDMADHLGRQPTETEQLALIKEKGHPMEVAAGYQPRKTLVSESLFPLYVVVLKWVLLAVFVVNGLVAALSLLSQPEANFIRAFLQWMAGTFNAGLHMFAWVTLGFYLAGETISYRNFFGKWDPRKLPDIVDGNDRISRFESAVELMAMMLFMGWLNDLFIHLPIAGDVVRFDLSDELRALLPWLNIAMALSIAMAVNKLFSPFWTKTKLLLAIALDFLWLTLFAMLFSMERVFSVRWPGVEGHPWAQDQPWDMPLTNWKVIMAIALGITAYDLVRNIQRYLRAGRHAVAGE